MVKKTIIIGNPCSPCKYLSHKVVECTRVFLSYGGGMGGANKTYYAEQMVGLPNGNLLLALVQGNAVEINPSFVVEKENCKIAVMKYDITAWKKLADASKVIEINYFKLDMHESLLVDKNNYTARHKGDLERRMVTIDHDITK